MTTDGALVRSSVYLLGELGCIELGRAHPEWWLPLATGAVACALLIAFYAVAELLVLLGVWRHID